LESMRSGDRERPRRLRSDRVQKKDTQEKEDQK
jgi:hypothetical protein